MNQINIEFDKWKNETLINGIKVKKGIKVRKHQEIEWEGETYIILHTEDQTWNHKASGLLKIDYL